MGYLLTPALTHYRILLEGSIDFYVSNPYFCT